MKPTEPSLIVTIDTECDKSANWQTASPLQFHGVLEAVPNRLQPLFTNFGVRPTYLLSPEVMTSPECCDALRSLRDVELSTHLHGDYIVPQIKTWDFAGSITDDMQLEYPPELERAKLATLTELFLQQFGYQPKSFRAGRFGIGHHTGRWLRELGYVIDSSVTPHIVWTSRRGEKTPDFRGFPEFPFTVGPDGDIWKPGESNFIELPVTILPVGTVLSNKPREPIWFRPWYSDADTLCRALNYVVSQPPVNGWRRPLVMMFHNVELVAGASPYPQTEADVVRYLDMLKQVFELAERLHVKACTMAEYYQQFFPNETATLKPQLVRDRPIELSSRTPELRLAPTLVESVLDRHQVRPWFKYVFHDRANRWDVWQPCFWVTTNHLPDSAVLSLGCGVGFNLFWLAENGFRNLYGCDIDPKAIAAGTEIARRTGLPVRLWVDDALRLQKLPSQKFAVIEALNWTHLVRGFSLGELLDTYLPLLTEDGSFIFDTIDAAYNNVPNNQFNTADWNKPLEQRQPSEYLTRLSESEVRAALSARGMTVATLFFEDQRVLRKVYVTRRATARQAITLQATAPASPVEVAEAYLQHGDYQSAVKSLEVAAKLDPNSPEILAALAKLRDQPGKDGSAKSVHPQNQTAKSGKMISSSPTLDQTTTPTPQAMAPASTTPIQKPRILLIADVPNWIFERHAHALHRYLADEFDFTLGYQGQQYNEDDYDLIYPLEWNLVPPEQIRSPAKYVTGLRSHFTWADRPFLPFINFLATKFQRVHVVSQRLHEIFRHSLPTVVSLSHGVDTVFFTPTTRADLSGRKLRLGWAGNRKSPVKGFAEFIEPLGRLPGVELVICGYSDRNLSLEQMKDFYNSIDAYVCASEFEGNNNSLMEAAAMARAIITTDNGTVPEYLRDGESALLVARQLPAFIKAVERLRDDPALRVALGTEARVAALEKWDWRERAQDYRTFFRASLGNQSELNQQPVLPRANDPLAIAAAHMQRGDYSSARKSLELAVQFTPDSPELIAALVGVCDKLGDTEAARRVRAKLEKSNMSTQPTVSGYSFCVITNGKRPEKLQREIESIRALNIPQYEILVGGDVPSGLDQVTVVSLPEAARAGQLGVMRNRLVERAKYEHVIVTDDDLLFQPDFYRGLLEFGEDYNVQCVRFLNPDGTRYWDWATSDGPKGHALLPYDQTDPHVYVTGGLCIMKKAVANCVKWDEQLAFYQAEDSEFSRRLHQAGISIRFNPHGSVVHDDPRHTQVDNFVVSADPIRQMARDAFRQNQFDRARYLVERLQAVSPNESIAPEPFELDSLVDKREGKYVYLCDEALDGLAEASGAEKVKRLNRVLGCIGPFYFQCGGAGDALLLMSTFYDKEPGSVIVSYPNSIPALKSLFEAFPALGTVYFLPAHASNEVNAKLRAIIPELPNCRGMGVTPKDDYVKEWNEQLDIFRKYKVDPRPQWAQRHPPSDSEKRVTVAPQGSLVGMAGTKRNIIEPGQWEELLRFLQGQGYRPAILGTPNERETYPCLDGCEDRRSFSFREQMDQIAGSARFVGADSWAKTFAALAGVPTFVFEAIKGHDWHGQKDPSDYVFVDPWDCLQVVSGLEALKDVLSRRGGGAQSVGTPTVMTAASTLHVAWEGTFTDNGSLSHVNRELTRALARQPNVKVIRVGDGKRAQAPARTQVTVRHAWPPNWQRPKHGAWVLIQPWEFGALPTDWVARLAGVDEVWAPTEYVRRVYVDSGVAPSKVKVVPNGIDPARFRPDAAPMKLATTKSFKFLFVGGTIHRKGPDLLLKAYLESFTAVDDVCLVIKDFGGNDVYAGQTFEARIREAQAQPNAPEILYLTRELTSEQMPGLYVACDCFVLPYRGEGFALPVLEAMGCGLPVIVTAGGATDDFATDEFAYRISARPHRIGYNVGPFKLMRPAWLLEPSLDELKERMQWVATHREEARAKGGAAGEYARREWTWERVALIAAQRLHEVAARAKDRSVGKAKRFELPTVARIGHLGEARELFEKKKYREAWDAAMAAMEVRPFHPEARKLLKEISKKSPAVGPVPNPPTEPRLTVCLIAKNEEKFIARCLQSVRDIAWQIVVVDTGSTDRTKEIARECGAETHEFKWCDDFSAARNAALEHVRGDWVLVLDADEELTAEGREVLRQEMLANNVMAYRLPIVDVGREEEGCSYVPRLFRNAPALFYVGRIHEQVFTSIEVRRQEWGLENKFGKATLLHHGYTAEMTQNRGKNVRNLRLLELAIEEMPNEPNLMMNYGLELVRAGQLELGLEQYIAAFRVLQSLPDEQIVPELRESLLAQLCTHLMMARKFEEIVTVLNTPLARKHRGLTASLHFALGLALMELKAHREAAEQFRQCLAKRDQPALTPMNRDIRKAGPHHCLATCLMQLREFDDAAEAFQQALAADPQSRAVRFDYATFLAVRGLPVEALKQLHALVAEKSDELPVWQLGGQIALSQPQFSEFACDWTGEGIKHFPQDRMLALQRAEALLLCEHVAEALPLWRQASASGGATHRAALIVCELFAGEPVAAIASDDEPAVSREFLKWYRRLLRWGASEMVLKLNENVQALRNVLPTAVITLEAALSEACQPVAV